MTALLAQTVDGIDVQAIKKRSADLQADAEAFVDQIKDRGDAFREEAVTVRDRGMENMRRVAATDLPEVHAGAVDFDEIVQGRSDVHNSALQSLMRFSYAVFCLTKI